MADWALPTDLVAPPRLVDRRLVPDDGAPPAKGAYRVRDPVTRRVTDEFAAEFQLPDPPGAPPIAPALDGEVRPFNETEFSTRRTQQLSTVEVVKCNGEYSVLLDGHAHRLAEGDGSTRLWLPRFHEQEVPNPQFGAGGGPPPAEPATRRAVAPLYVGLRLERDEFAPLSARIEVTQRVVDGERVRLKGAPVQTIPLTPYGVDDLTTGVVTLPYPAIHTRGPHVILEDNGSVRKAEAAAFIEERRGVFSAAQRSIFGAYSLAGASGDAGGAGFQDFPRLLMSAVLPECSPAAARPRRRGQARRDPPRGVHARAGAAQRHARVGRGGALARPHAQRAARPRPRARGGRPRVAALRRRDPHQPRLGTGDGEGAQRDLPGAAGAGRGGRAVLDSGGQESGE